MCGRYTFSEIDDVAERFGLDYVPELRTNMNVAPSQTMPVITRINSKNVLKMMKWGIPRFMGPGKVKDVFNTRSDKAFHNWKKLTMAQRVLVPATGFYEWQKQVTGKQPYFIHPKGEGLFAFAGIWSNWKLDDGKEIQTYSIMTTEPNEDMLEIHNRMPVILHQKDESTWISEEHNNDESLLSELLVPYDNNALEMFTNLSSIKFIDSENRNLMKPLEK